MPDRRGAFFAERSATNEVRTPRKLYANASYGPPWPGENRPRAPVERVSIRTEERRNRLDVGVCRRDVTDGDRLGRRQNRACGRAPARLLHEPGRKQDPAPGRSICGR